MEKSVFWCLQPKYLPEGLIRDEDELAHHVLRASNDKDMPRNTYRSHHDYSVQHQGYHRIDSPVGRYQAELLLRSAHRAIDGASDDLQKAWEEIDYSCEKLTYRGILYNYSGKDTVHRTSHYPTHFISDLSFSDQHILQDQVALFFERMFTIYPPSHSFEWVGIIRLLLEARSDSSSPLSSQILPDVINRQLPVWIRKHKSASLLYGIGYATHFWSEISWMNEIELFTHLDKIMVDMCSDPEGVEGLDKGSVEKWRDLRKRFIEKTRDPDWEVPEQSQLPDGHFDDLPGHGLLLLQPSPQPASTGPSGPDTDVGLTTDTSTGI